MFFSYSYLTKIDLDEKLKDYDTARNYGGFDYNLYLRIYCRGSDSLPDNNLSFVQNIRQTIKTHIKNIIPDDEGELLSGLLIGDKDDLPDEIKEKFRDANLSHMLAISRCACRIFDNWISIFVDKSENRKTIISNCNDSVFVCVHVSSRIKSISSTCMYNGNICISR